MHHILLIEDNNDVRENTAEILELAGYRVSTAPDGKKGIEAVNSDRPDLIVCDIMMPVLDGYGVLHLLGKNAGTANIPFIFLTAKTERAEIRRGMEMGADDYITKPFDKIELLSAVQSRLKKAEALKKEYRTDLDGLTEFISDFSGKNALEKFVQEKKTFTTKKKDLVYREGDYMRGIYFLNSGKLKAFKSHEHGKEFITSLLGPGDFFGFTALLRDTDANESVQALEDSEITLIPREEFFNLVYNNREVAKKFLHLLTTGMTEQQEQLLDLAYSSVRKRVAESLIILQKKYKAEKDEVFSISIPREDLANLAGTATETTIRTLADFKEEGLIDIKGGSITITNSEKLSKLKN